MCRFSTPGGANREGKALLDTGADSTMVPSHWVPQDCVRIPQPIIGAGGESVVYQALGDFRFRFPFSDQDFSLPSILLHEQNTLLCGRDLLGQMHAALHIPEGFGPEILPALVAPALGLEHFPEPPNEPQFPLNQNASRP